jgi:hypothetical protein
MTGVCMITVADSDVVGAQLTEANPWVTGSVADPPARQLHQPYAVPEVRTQYRRSEMTVNMHTSVVTLRARG